MMEMEFVDTDYSVLLNYPENVQEVENTQGIQEQPKTEQTAAETSRPVEEIPGWTFAYCQQFFDVTTREVLNRVGMSIRPLPSSDFLADVIQNKPDLYGPIWICITLALELGITSDLAHLAQFSAERPWRSSVNTVYRASVLLFLYSWCVPALIWIVLEWNPIYEVKYKLTDLLCIYGYASAVFLPTVALWTLPVLWLRWISLLLAAFISGILICRSLKKAFVKLDRSGYYAIQILLFTLNLIIGISFNTLFFPNHQSTNSYVFDVTFITNSHRDEPSHNHKTIPPHLILLLNATTGKFNLSEITNATLNSS
ncbi:hypothetical protein GE061_006870 [Apolygus lucorum]|uniref:Protein YIPF n=1 Tax=Apolygus lucorum TaxID=248454 RepID=A0A6A4J8D7_APOLU|nr:hypothetical protein GE061_006870 [Apolygus lucorum]